MSFLAAAGSIAAAEALAAAAMAGTTAAQMAAAALAAEAATAAAAAGATAVAVPTVATTLPAAFGAAGSSLGATGTGLTVGSGLGATGVGGAGLGTTGLTVGSGLGASGGAGLGGLGASAGAGGLGTLGTAAAAEGAIGASGATAGEVAGEKALEQGAKKGLEQVARQAPADLDAMGQPAAQPNLSAVAEPKPITPSTPSSSGNNPFSSMDAFNRNALNNASQGYKVAGSAPVVAESAPIVAEAGGEGAKDAWTLALEDQGATAAQRTAMEDSAKMFGDVGGKYESAITKTPVERSFLDKAGEWAMDNKLNIALGGLGLAQMMPPSSGVNPISEDMIRPYTYSEEDTSDQEADPKGREKIRYKGSYSAGTPYKAAQGGLLSLHRGGNFLSGGGDGMSDDIPAMIGTKQPARLADGEFVIPADVVSHIGNGSSKAGAEKLYAMMDKIRQERTGRKRQSPQINAAKYLPR